MIVSRIADGEHYCVVGIGGPNLPSRFHSLRPVLRVPEASGPSPNAVTL